MSTSKTTGSLRSAHLGEEVRCARWGHFGTPVLLYPTAGGDAEECERMHLIAALEPLLTAGAIKVYACDSVAGRVLMKQPERFGEAQTRFDRFVYDEFVPWIRHDCQSPDIGIVTAGASIGAYNAVAAVCRHPDVFTHAIGMSGTYDLTKWVKTPMSTDFYLSSPIHYLRALGDSPQLTALRSRFITLATGNGRWEDAGESWRMAQILGAKGIPNRVDEWGPSFDHDWSTWRTMLPRYLARS
jgi:esterase/lipase superfamily enzyme